LSRENYSDFPIICEGRLSRQKEKLPIDYQCQLANAIRFRLPHSTILVKRQLLHRAAILIAQFLLLSANNLAVTLVFRVGSGLPLVYLRSVQDPAHTLIADQNYYEFRL
jgi:hypothetical protein